MLGHYLICKLYRTLLSDSLLTSSDETEPTQPAEDGMELEEPSKETTEEAVVPTEPELPSEFDKLFKGCEDNPEDFNGWVYLLQYVEQEVRQEIFTLFLMETGPEEIKFIYFDDIIW